MIPTGHAMMSLAGSLLGQTLRPLVPSKSAADLEEGVPLNLKKIRTRPAEPVINVDVHAGADALASPRIKAQHTEAAAPGTPRLRSALKTFMVIALWYLSNTAMLLLNKYLLGSYGFRFPVFLTACHMLACLLMSQAADSLGLVRHQALQSRAQLWKIALLATTFLASVVLGNVSLRFIPVSFAQAMGAVTPAMTAAFAFLLLGAVESCATLATLLPVMAGIVLAAGFEPSFSAAGFAAAMGAAAARALKAVLQGVLLADQAEKLDSMNLLRLMAPISLALLLPAIGALEPGAPAAAARLATANPAFAALLAGNAALAYVVNLTNFLVTRYTSALTLQVLGCAKGVFATVVSVLLFRNPITFLGMAGYSLTVGGVFAYGWTKKRM